MESRVANCRKFEKCGIKPYPFCGKINTIIDWVLQSALTPYFWGWKCANTLWPLLWNSVPKHSVRLNFLTHTKSSKDQTAISNHYMLKRSETGKNSSFNRDPLKTDFFDIDLTSGDPLNLEWKSLSWKGRCGMIDFVAILGSFYIKLV